MHNDLAYLISRLERIQADAERNGNPDTARITENTIYHLIQGDEQKHRPVEVHVTVAPTDIEKFFDACRRLEVKPLILLLFNQHGGTIQEDMLTVSRVNSIEQGLLKVDSLAYDFERLGLDVIRRKIEIHPSFEETYPPTNYSNSTMYVESHIDVKIDFTKHNLPLLFETLAEQGAMPSSNVSKIDTIIVTTRAFEGGLKELWQKNDKVTSSLLNHGFTVGDIETEMAVFDDNFYHDRVWSEKMKPHAR